MKWNKNSKPEKGEVWIRSSMVQRVRNVLYPLLRMMKMLQPCALRWR